LGGGGERVLSVTQVVDVLASGDQRGHHDSHPQPECGVCDKRWTVIEGLHKDYTGSDVEGLSLRLSDFSKDSRSSDLPSASVATCLPSTTASDWIAASLSGYWARTLSATWVRPRMDSSRTTCQAADGSRSLSNTASRTAPMTPAIANLPAGN